MAQDLAPIPELYVSYDSAQKLKLEAADLLSHDLTPRQICDLELLMNGGFNPLKGFLSEADYNGVLDNMRLSDGALWPMPVTLDVTADFADTVELGQDIALRDQEGHAGPRYHSRNNAAYLHDFSTFQSSSDFARKPDAPRHDLMARGSAENTERRQEVGRCVLWVQSAQPSCSIGCGA